MAGRLARVLLSTALALSAWPRGAWAGAAAAETRQPRAGRAVHNVTIDRVTLMAELVSVFEGTLGAGGRELEPASALSFLRTYIGSETASGEARRTALEALKDPDLRGELLAALEAADEPEGSFTAELRRRTIGSLRRYELAFAALPKARKPSFLSALPALRTDSALAPNSRELLARARERGVGLSRLADTIQSSADFSELRERLESLGLLEPGEHRDPSKIESFEYAARGLWYAAAPPDLDAPVLSTVVRVEDMEFHVHALPRHGSAAGRDRLFWPGERAHVRRLMRQGKKEGRLWYLEQRLGEFYGIGSGKEINDHDAARGAPVRATPLPPVRRSQVPTPLFAIKLALWAAAAAGLYWLWQDPSEWIHWTTALVPGALSYILYRFNSLLHLFYYLWLTRGAGPDELDVVEHARRTLRVKFGFRPRVEEYRRLELPMPLGLAAAVRPHPARRSRAIAQGSLEDARRERAATGRTRFDILAGFNHLAEIAWFLLHPEEAR